MKTNFKNFKLSPMQAKRLAEARERAKARVNSTTTVYLVEEVRENPAKDIRACYFLAPGSAQLGRELFSRLDAVYWGTADLEERRGFNCGLPGWRLLGDAPSVLRAAGFEVVVKTLEDQEREREEAREEREAREIERRKAIEKEIADIESFDQMVSELAVSRGLVRVDNFDARTPENRSQSKVVQRIECPLTGLYRILIELPDSKFVLLHGISDSQHISSLLPANAQCHDKLASSQSGVMNVLP